MHSMTLLGSIFIVFLSRGSSCRYQFAGTTCESRSPRIGRARSSSYRSAILTLSFVAPLTADAPAWSNSTKQAILEHQYQVHVIALSWHRDGKQKVAHWLALFKIIS